MVFPQKGIISALPYRSTAIGMARMENVEGKGEINKKTRIKDLPPLERLREKLLELGAEKLSDKELLAILIGARTKEKSALDIAEEMLSKFGGFSGIAGRNIDDIIQIKGIKVAKTVNIAATFEIARRIVIEVLKSEESF